MRSIIAAIATLLLACAIPAEPPAKAPFALKHKLVGAWKGQTPCTGKLLMRSDGTYVLTGHGPAASDTAGVWSVRGGSTGRTLTLTCTKSELSEDIGTVEEMALIHFDDQVLEAKNTKGDVNRFARVRK